MQFNSEHLTSPILLKDTENPPWPQDEFFYLLTGDGLFQCRNHQFFRSCVPAPSWPAELAGQKPFLKMNYPRISRLLFERVVGFFDMIAEKHGAEAAVLLGYNAETRTIEPLVPKQVGTVGTTWYGDSFPMDLTYEVPPVPPHITLIGDIHSHVDGPAYASSVDKDDELHRPGLHLVVGRIWDEPPQFHCEVTVDQFRFMMKDLSVVLEGYSKRSYNVPKDWIERVTVKPWSSCKSSGQYSNLKPIEKNEEPKVIAERDPAANTTDRSNADSSETGACGHGGNHNPDLKTP